MKFKLEDCKVMNTPMRPTYILRKEDTGTKVDQKLYKGMIDSLLYLTASRPDILFSISSLQEKRHFATFKMTDYDC